jgi:uncharacterized protein YggT (Ycf19 family)
MTEDDKLAIDESRRLARHEAVKGAALGEAQAEIMRHADRLDEDDRARAAAVSAQMREKAIAEVARTEAEIERARGVARVSQVVDYVFYLIYGLISLEIMLELLGAREDNAFRQLITALTSPLLAPFRSLVPDPASGRFQLRLSYLVALAVYLLLHLAINGLLRLLAHQKTAV